MTLPIITAPNSVLREATKPVTKLDKKTLQIIEDMIATLKAAKQPEGVGLAAPQIGVSLRIFLTRPDPKHPDAITIFINPEITKYSQRQQSSADDDGVLEGCLSLPNYYSPLTRSMSVTVKYQTLADISNHSLPLVEKTEVFSGFPAHVVQHEMDHLNGILFIDRVLEQESPLYKVNGKKWEEVSL